VVYFARDSDKQSTPGVWQAAGSDNYSGENGDSDDVFWPAYYACVGGSAVRFHGTRSDVW
jgi:hypothetical protein